MKLGKHGTRVLVVMLLLAGAGEATNAESRSNLIAWMPGKLTNGSPVLFTLSAPVGVESISGTCLGHSFGFFRRGRSESWYALAGVPFEAAPGTYTLRIEEITAHGRTLEIQKQLLVARASYPKIPVKVAKQFTEPSPAQLTAIAQDKDTKEKIFQVVSHERLWTGPFVAPVSAPVSDVFGTERVFNHEVQSRHQGLDYGVPTGTVVRAINSGTVLLARPMFFEGNFLVIDHGQGLLSLYLHLSGFKVKEGDEVHSGDIIALSGATGRATGPHLHLAIRWQGVYLDPAVLLKLPIPPS
jgi:murein DD-endopeptidase MepM/ murein hydrolase activator NlpD